MQASRDDNNVPSLLFVGSDGETYPVEGDEATGRIFVDVPGGGSGTVTSVSVVSANGLAGTVATATTTPAITLTTSITGILKGNGTAISAVTVGTGLAYDGTTLSSTATGNVTKVGTPVDNQIGVWTGDGTIEGTAGLTFASNVLGVGTAANGTVQSNGNFDLILQTGNATTGNITIADGANADITIAPNGSGQAIIKSSAGGSSLYVYDSITNNYILNDVGTNYTQIFASDSSSGSSFEAYTASGGTYVTLTDTSAGATGPGIFLYHDSASPAINDVVGQLSFGGEDSGGGSNTYALIKGVITDPTAASEDGKLVFQVLTAGTSADELELDGAALYPTTNNGLALGNATNQFADLFLAAGGVINFDNGDVTIEDGVDTLSFDGATGGYLFGAGPVVPQTTNASALGTTSKQWADLFLAEGGVINWDNGDATITQTESLLAVDGANLSLSGNSLTSVGGIEMGSGATDTTIARVAAGLVSVEGEVMNGWATTATAAGTTTLAVTDKKIQFFTGTTTQNVNLPTTSVVAGQQYIVYNAGTTTGAVLTVRSSGSNDILKMSYGVYAIFTALQATPTTAAHWSVSRFGAKNTITATSYTTDTGTSLNIDYYDEFIVTAQAGALLINNPSGTARDGQTLIIAITGTGARALTYGAQFEASTVALPTTTVTTARLNMGFIWRADTSKWVCIASA